MTANLDIANRALQLVGTRTNMTSSEFTNQTSNEAIQSQLIMFKLRDDLIRMAPWDCVEKYANLVYITSVPTTPENATAGAPLWGPGIPAPPWAYEYQYPVDCLRAIKIIPQYTAQAGGVPIFPPGTATGGNQIGWTGPALKFKVSTDTFFAVVSAVVSAGGAGHAIGDILTLVQPSFTFTQVFNGVSQTFTMPVGAPAQLRVATLGGGGAVATVTVVNEVSGEADTGSPGPLGGSYFGIPTNPVAVNYSLSTSAGNGASFTLTFGSAAPQRVILANQQQAILCYNAQVTDPNVMDPLFQDAWVAVLAARLSYQLTGDKQRANELIQVTNGMIMEARKVDGNEGITVNDVTPDFLRIRGNWGGPNWEYTPNMSFDWGSFYSPY